MSQKHATKFFVGAFFLLVFAGVLIFIASHMFTTQTDYLSSLSVQDAQIGETFLSLYVADEPAEHARGLSYISALPEGTGMLFMFSESYIPRFWMKDMQFTLDILWIDADGVIVDMDHNVAPETYPDVFSPEIPVQYVAELPAGFATENNIEVGDALLFAL